MIKDELKVLLIEDNAGDAFLMKFYLGESISPKFELLHAETIAAAFDYLSHTKFDIVLMDLNLPDSLGMETVKKLLDKFPDNLVIVLTGLIDEKVGLETVRYGAQDFLVKGKFDSKVLISSILFAFERYHLNKSLQKINIKLSEDTRRFNNLQEIHQTGYFEFHIDSKELYVSNFAQKILSFSHPRNYIAWEELAVKVENAGDITAILSTPLQDGSKGQLFVHLINPKQTVEVNWRVDANYYYGSIKDV